MPFLSLAIDLAGDLDPEVAEDACLRAGALSITLTDTRDDPVLEPAPGEVRLWPATRLTALFAGDVAAHPLVERIACTLALAPGRLTVSVVADRAWEREWLADFHAMRFGRRLWVAPSHEPVADPAAVVVDLDPGLAFGTGTHASTALCLEWLDSHPPSGSVVIDYGCGSGLLGIACAKLGAALVYAWDIDPQALTATRENAVRNGVTAAVRIPASEPALPENAGLLVANILAGTLAPLAARFARLVRPGGDLVLSGLLAAEGDEVTRAYAPWFDIRSFGSRDGWLCLAGVRRADNLS